MRSASLTQYLTAGFCSAPQLSSGTRTKKKKTTALIGYKGSGFGHPHFYYIFLWEWLTRPVASVGFSAGDRKQVCWFYVLRLIDGVRARLLRFAEREGLLCFWWLWVFFLLSLLLGRKKVMVTSSSRLPGSGSVTPRRQCWGRFQPSRGKRGDI